MKKINKSLIAGITIGMTSMFAIVGCTNKSEAKAAVKSPGGIKIEQLEDSLNRTTSIFTDEYTGVQYLVIEKGGSQGAVAIQPLLGAGDRGPVTVNNRQ